MEKWFRRIFIFLLALMIWFNLVNAREIGSKELEYNEAVTKIENNEVSRVLVEKNENRAFVYMKEDSTYYMVNLASFGDMQNLVFNSTDYKEGNLTYIVQNFEYPPFLVSSVFVLAISFCINFGMETLSLAIKKMRIRKKANRGLDEQTDDKPKENYNNDEKTDPEKQAEKSDKKFTDFLKSFPGSDSDFSFVPRPIINEKTRFSDVIGLEYQLEELKDIVSFLREPTLYRDMNAQIPKGVLLYGPSGTGKTLLARAIAGEAHTPFYYVSASQLQSMYVGGSEKNIRRLFAAAKETAPSIVFIDEIDSIATQRYSENSNKYTASVLNQLLTCIDGFEESSGVIVIAATNNKDVLDSAILRRGRFDRHIYMPLPDVKAREKLIEYYLKDKCYYFEEDDTVIEDDSKYIKEIASFTTYFSGSDIKTLINEAAILAVRNRREYINMKDIHEAFRKITVGVKNGRMEEDKEVKRLTAIHEAGHAIVSRLLGKTPLEISIIPRDQAGGYNLITEKEKSYYSVEDVLREVKISLGGRAAEKVILNKIYSGASADLQQATNLLYQMYTVYGMNSSEEVSLVLTSNNKLNEIITRDSAPNIKFQLNKCYEETINLLKPYIEVIKSLAEKLIQMETMEPSEIVSFFEQNKI